VIGEPPLLVGADQERLTCVGENGVAESPVGALGELAVGCDDGGADVDVGVAVASFDSGLAPSVKYAETT